MTKQDKPTKAEKIAELMHNIYEDKVREFGWFTQEKTRVPFNELPESTKQIMLAIAEALISTIRREAVESFVDECLAESALLDEEIGIDTAMPKQKRWVNIDKLMDLASEYLRKNNE